MKKSANFDNQITLDEWRETIKYLIKNNKSLDQSQEI